MQQEEGRRKKGRGQNTKDKLQKRASSRFPSVFSEFALCPLCFSFFLFDAFISGVLLARRGRTAQGFSVSVFSVSVVFGAVVVVLGLVALVLAEPVAAFLVALVVNGSLGM